MNETDKEIQADATRNDETTLIMSASEGGDDECGGDVDLWEVITFPTWVIIATTLIVASLVFLHRFRNKPIVAMGQPRILSVMCAGSLLIVVGLTIRTAYDFARVVGNVDTYTSTQRIIYVISACFIHSGICMVDLSLFFKLYRVYKVTQFRRVETIRPQHIRLPFVLGMMVSLAFSLVQVCFALESDSCVGDCVFPKGEDKSKISAAINFTINSLFRLGILVFAYKLRNVDESIGDTRRIMRHSFFMFFIKIPWSILCFADRLSETKIRPILFFSMWALVAMAGPAFLVLPRMYLVWYKQEYGKFPTEIQMYGTGEVHVCCKTMAAAEAASAATTTTTATEPATTASQERSRTIRWEDSLIIKVDRNDDKGKKGRDDDLECREIEEEENV